MNQELITAFMRSAFPCNPLPFLQGLIDGVKEQGTDFIKTDQAKALLLVINQQSYGQASTIDTFEEFCRLKQALTAKPKYQSLAPAVEHAIKLSTETGYAAIVLSRGEYYVESDVPLIRVWEELTGEYKDGKLIAQ